VTLRNRVINPASASPRDASHKNKNAGSSYPWQDSYPRSIRSFPLKNCNKWKPFPTHVLPPVIRKFVEEGAASIGCDPAAIALPLLAALASAIGNTRRIRIKNGWLAPPILWPVIIGRSGSQKSPAFKYALKPLDTIQRELLSEWMKHQESGGDAASHPLERLTVGDITIEALADVLQANSRGLLLRSEELAGWITNFGRYGKGDRSSGDAARWLVCYDAGYVEVDRRTDKKHIVVSNASISVCGTIQPGILHQAIGKEHRENGLLPRMLLAYPPQKKKTWQEAEVDETTVGKVTDVLRNLRKLDFRLDRFQNEHPEIINLSPQAKGIFVTFYGEHAEYQHKAETDDLAAAFSKLEETTARLALVLQLTRCASGGVTDCKEIDSKNMSAAIELTHWFREETRRVYQLLDQSAEAKQFDDMARWIRTKHSGNVAPRDLVAGRRDIKDAIHAEAALQSLSESGYGEWYSVPPTDKGGAPTRRFRLVG
jgi:pyridoxine 5'-phosphate synthase PdxJ